MQKKALGLVLVALAVAPLAGCTGESGSGDRELGDLRADLQRMQRESDKQRELISTLQRRVEGLAEDLPRMRRASLDTVAVAPANGSDVAAGTDGAAAAPVNGIEGAGVRIPEAPAIKAFLESEEGRNSVASAVKAVQDKAEADRAQRMVDGLLARLVKDAELTEDQTKKMKDILDRSATQMRALFQPMRDGGGDATPEGRQQAMAKLTELRQAADIEVKAVLSQTQYDIYQKQMPQGTGGYGFGGGGRGGRPGNN